MNLFSYGVVSLSQYHSQISQETLKENLILDSIKLNINFIPFY